MNKIWNIISSYDRLNDVVFKDLDDNIAIIVAIQIRDKRIDDPELGTFIQIKQKNAEAIDDDYLYLYIDQAINWFKSKNPTD